MKVILKAVSNLLLIAVLAGAAYFLFAKMGGKREEAAAPREERVVPVSLTPLETRAFEDAVAVQGNIRAKNFAMVSPVIGGNIEQILVQEGDAVKAGETVLFTVDSVNLRHALDVRRQDRAVAENARKQAEARLEQVRADFEKAEVDLRRYELLYEDNVVPVDVLEMQQSRHKQMKAALDMAGTMVQLSREQEEQAGIAVEIAQKTLDDATTKSPIDGVVTMKLAEAGEMAQSGHPVVRVEDMGVLEASAYLPAEHFDKVRENETEVRVSVYGKDLGTVKVTYKSPSINPKLRAFEIRCALGPLAGGVSTGAIADLSVVFARRDGLAAPSSALVKRGGGTLLFTVEGDAARAHEVAAGLANGGWTEIQSAGGLAAGIPVVTMGQSLVEDGGKVQIQDASK
jgi:RND family efflux transporter MFP subunit